MLVVYLVFIFNSLPLHEAGFSYQHPNNTYFQKCISDIIRKYFHNYKALSMVDMNTENEEVHYIVNHVQRNTIILRESNTRFRTQNDGYFIVAGNYKDFIYKFPDLVKEIYWQPKARFLIVIKYLTKSHLRGIFDILLAYHVANVLVMSETPDPDMYTYDPFANYGCGQRYDRIIEYGKCSMSQEHLYPNKLVTGLRNCIFKVASPHWPPYTIDPARNNDPIGIEEVIIREIGELEHFQVIFSYSDDAEEFTTIEKGVVAVGPLDMLQKREVQMIAGGMILTHPRAQVFDYLWGHLANTDEISYQVKRATGVAPWKFTYLEFDAFVWTVLVIAFIVFLLIFVVLVRPRDKGLIALKMIGFLLLAGHIIRGNFFTRYLFIHWVLFAYVINVYYVSNLVSLTTNPPTNYQISTEEDLVKYNIKPCVSRVIMDYLASVDVNDSIWKNQRTGCEYLLESIRTVSKSNELYTIALRSIYNYDKKEWGDGTIYTFNEPLAKAVYAIYLYKGFPMLNKLHLQTLRMRENGLVDRYLGYLYWMRRRKYHFKSIEMRYYVVVPWYILIFGSILSGVVFLMEIIVKKLSINRPLIPILKECR